MWQKYFSSKIKIRQAQSVEDTVIIVKTNGMRWLNQIENQFFKSGLLIKLIDIEPIKLVIQLILIV